jgi:thiol-disulfide isomerase/thioredoxin
VDAQQFAAERARHRGHLLFVNFWATWCEPCKEELPVIVRAAQAWRSRGVHFISISADDPDNLGRVRKELDQRGARFDAVLIATGDLDAMIRQTDIEWTGSLPASFLYSPSGERIRSRIGTVDPPLLDTWFSRPGR